MKLAGADAHVGTVAEFAHLLACFRANVSSSSVQKLTTNLMAIAPWPEGMQEQEVSCHFTTP